MRFDANANANVYALLGIVFGESRLLNDLYISNQVGL